MMIVQKMKRLVFSALIFLIFLTDVITANADTNDDDTPSEPIDLTLVNPQFSDRVDFIDGGEDFSASKVIDKDSATIAKSKSKGYVNLIVNIDGAQDLTEVILYPVEPDAPNDYTIYEDVIIAIGVKYHFNQFIQCPLHDDNPRSDLQDVSKYPNEGYVKNGIRFDCSGIKDTYAQLTNKNETMQPANIKVQLNKRGRLALSEIKAKGINMTPEGKNAAEENPKYQPKGSHFAQIPLKRAAFRENWADKQPSDHYNNWWYNCVPETAIDGNWKNHDPYSGFALSAEGMTPVFTVEINNPEIVQFIAQVVVFPRRYPDGCCQDYYANIEVSLVSDEDNAKPAICYPEQDLSDSTKYIEQGFTFDCMQAQVGTGKAKKIKIIAYNDYISRLGLVEVMAFGQGVPGSDLHAEYDDPKIELREKYAPTTNGKKDNMLTLMNPEFSNENFLNDLPFYCPATKAVDNVIDVNDEFTGYAMSVPNDDPNELTNFIVDIDNNYLYQKISKVFIFPKKYTGCDNKDEKNEDICLDHYGDVEVFVGLQATDKNEKKCELDSDANIPANQEAHLKFNCDVEDGYYIRVTNNKPTQLAIVEIMAFAILDDWAAGFFENSTANYLLDREVYLKNPRFGQDFGIGSHENTTASEFDMRNTAWKALDGHWGSDSLNDTITQRPDNEPYAISSKEYAEFAVSVHNPNIYKEIAYVVVYPKKNWQYYEGLKVHILRTKKRTRSQCEKVEGVNLADVNASFESGFLFNCTKIQDVRDIIVSSASPINLAISEIAAYGTLRRFSCCNDITKSCCFRIDDRYTFSFAIPKPSYTPNKRNKIIGKNCKNKQRQKNCKKTKMITIDGPEARTVTQSTQEAPDDAFAA